MGQKHKTRPILNVPLKDSDFSNKSLQNYVSVLSGAVTDTGILGESNGAFYFDGINDNITFGDLDLVGDFTICFWAYLDPGRNNDYTVLSSKRGTSDYFTNWNYGIDDRDATSSNFKASFTMGGGGVIATNIGVNNALSNFNIWHHHCFMIEGTLLKLYIDGVLIGSNTFSGTRQYDSSNARVTSYANSGTTYMFKGKMCDVRYYNRALSQSEINLIYNNSNRIKS